MFSAPGGAAGGPAGEISALMPAAELNSKPAKAKEGLAWNDLLHTEHTGRLRAALLDGSMLSMGSDSDLRVLQHDAQSQQTSLQLAAGQLRSRVIKITKPNGKFEVNTPHAVIGVIGTDFYVDVNSTRTRVICYTGKVSVTPIGSSTVLSQNSNGSSNGSGNSSLDVPAGSMVEVGLNIVPVVQPTPKSLQEASMQATNLGDQPIGSAKGATHTLRNTIIGIAASGGVAGLVLGTTQAGGGTVPGVCPPANISVCGVSRPSGATIGRRR
jgi:hypothetical protein